jgi:hypothetical protein
MEITLLDERNKIWVIRMANKSINAEKKWPTSPEDRGAEEIRFKGAQFQLVASALTVVVAVLSIISSFKSPELSLVPLIFVMIFALMLLASIAGIWNSSSSTMVDWIRTLNYLEKLRLFARWDRERWGSDFHEELYNDRLLMLYFAALAEGKKDLANALLEKGRMEKGTKSRRSSPQGDKQ